MAEPRPVGEHERADQASGRVLSRAFAVLEVLARELKPMRLSAVALRLGLQKSSTHRVLATLIGLGYVEREPDTGCYRATLRLWELGSGTAAQHPVKRVATPFLQQLHQSTRETVSLMILSGDDVLYLDQLVSPRPMRFISGVGTRMPAPMTAGGKAMLAYEPEARAIARRARRTDLSNGLGVDALLRELVQVRCKGYAESDVPPGIVSFGAPIMARDGRAAAALMVSAPAMRVTMEKRGELVEQLLVTCGEISERLGNF